MKEYVEAVKVAEVFVDISDVISYLWVRNSAHFSRKVYKQMGSQVAVGSDEVYPRCKWRTFHILEPKAAHRYYLSRLPSHFPRHLILFWTHINRSESRYLLGWAFNTFLRHALIWDMSWLCCTKTSLASIRMLCGILSNGVSSPKSSSEIMLDLIEIQTGSSCSKPHGEFLLLASIISIRIWDVTNYWLRVERQSKSLRRSKTFAKLTSILLRNIWKTKTFVVEIWSSHGSAISIVKLNNKIIGKREKFAKILVVGLSMTLGSRSGLALIIVRSPCFGWTGFLVQVWHSSKYKTSLMCTHRNSRQNHTRIRSCGRGTTCSEFHRRVLLLQAWRWNTKFIYSSCKINPGTDSLSKRSSLALFLWKRLRKQRRGSDINWHCRRDAANDSQ